MGTTNGERGEQPVLTGPRVRLRPWRPDDVTAVSDACQDPEIQRWTQVPVPYLREHAEDFVTRIAGSVWAEGGALFAVEPRDGGPLIASIGIFPPTDGHAEAGYWTVEGQRGHGYTAEALRAERAGFTAEGVVRDLHRGRPADFLLYSLLPGDRRRDAGNAADEG